MIAQSGEAVSFEKPRPAATELGHPPRRGEASPYLCLAPFQHAIEETHQERDSHNRNQDDDDAEGRASADIERLTGFLVDEIGKVVVASPDRRQS